MWCFSAFCFELANHGLLSAVQGTVKEPEAIVDQFIRHQASFDKIPTKCSEKCLRGLTNVSESVKTVCGDEVDFFFSRFHHLGKCFASLSYTRFGENLSEWVSSTINFFVFSLVFSLFLLFLFSFFSVFFSSFFVFRRVFGLILVFCRGYV